MSDEVKPWYQSKTLRVNAIAAALMALEANAGLLQPLLPVNFYAAMSVFLAVANAFLRVVTTQAVQMNTEQGP